MTILLIVGGTLLGTALLWGACSRLELATHQLAQHYRIPEIVQGSLLMAVASSVPELATAVLAMPLHNDFELGVSAIIGSAIYNVLVIPAFSVFARGGPIRVNAGLVYREALFYLAAVASLMVVLSLAVIYNGDPVAAGLAGGPVTGRFTTTLAFFPLLLYAIYLFIQLEEMRDARPEIPPAKDIDVAREWIMLVVTTAVILVGVEMLLRVAITLADLLNTPTFLWGMTVVAAATSLPDTFISVRASMLGRTTSSLSNVLGSNIFDLLVAVPVSVVIAGAVTVNFTQVVPMMTFLMVATIVMLVQLRRDWELTKPEATVMMALYLSFGIWMCLEAFGLTDVLGMR